MTNNTMVYGNRVLNKDRENIKFKINVILAFLIMINFNRIKYNPKLFDIIKINQSF